MKARLRQIFVMIAPNAYGGTATRPARMQPVGTASNPLQHTQTGLSHFPAGMHLSRWSQSGAKRFFDCICVISALPLLVPILLAVALGVRITSSGPVLFCQRRMSGNGRGFTILKFRTMIHDSGKAHRPVTTNGNQRFTPIGRFLRRWKLDELPQLLNVLAGHMSLVGPRPKLPEHALLNLHCRAGITGAATAVFAREEAILERVPKRHLDCFYFSAVLPAKHELDADYMARATFLSDLKLIVESVLRRWDCSVVEGLVTTWTFEQEGSEVFSEMADAGGAVALKPIRQRLHARTELSSQEYVSNP
jgi:lipopolysaccharide/colanic/teichoic acid biosynthesis glycosyltransferase